MKTLGLLLFVILLVAFAGYVAGWLEFSSESHAGDTEVSVRVDDEELSADAERAKEKVQDLKRRVLDDGHLAASGTVEEVDDSTFTLVDGDGRSTTYLLDDDTDIEVGGSGDEAGALRIGDRVTVWTDDDGPETLARRVVIAR